MPPNQPDESLVFSVRKQFDRHPGTTSQYEFSACASPAVHESGEKALAEGGAAARDVAHFLRHARHTCLISVHRSRVARTTMARVFL